MKTKEHYLSGLDEIYSAGSNSKTMLEKAYERVKEIISSHKPAVNMNRIEKVNAYVYDKIKEIMG